MSKIRVLRKTERGDKDFKYLYIKMVDESFEPAKEYFIITEGAGFGGDAEMSEKLFEETREMFAAFIKAYICEDNYLVLQDQDGNEMHLSGCTSGFPGTGPKGTLNILRKLEFDIDLLNLIFMSPTFSIRNLRHGRYVDNPPGYVTGTAT
ncbi:hypothetical protein [Paenibacillus alkalitolerans]|uniref:hypothetical protein n=1 Tax=Paenibacillus alkalitolerans TaxID=2799335 RepID=UPI0018F695CF|nr:hypothetical protein [Paenibacillus alkalitolerans]